MGQPRMTKKTRGSHLKLIHTYSILLKRGENLRYFRFGKKRGLSTLRLWVSLFSALSQYLCEKQFLACNFSLAYSPISRIENKIKHNGEDKTERGKYGASNRSGDGEYAVKTNQKRG